MWHSQSWLCIEYKDTGISTGEIDSYTVLGHNRHFQRLLERTNDLLQQRYGLAEMLRFIFV